VIERILGHLGVPTAIPAPHPARAPPFSADILDATGWDDHAPTKAFVVAFGEGLAYELRNTGVRVVTVCPGFTKTGLYAVSGVPGLAGKLLPMARPEDVVDSALGAYDSGRVLHVVGFMNKMMGVAGAMTPRFLLRGLMAMMFAPTTKAPAPSTDSKAKGSAKA
jgi:NAD(P)-dependent dehydrogenase (short-subunit alcohol dehydrogenase family)